MFSSPLWSELSQVVVLGDFGRMEHLGLGGLSPIVQKGPPPRCSSKGRSFGAARPMAFFIIVPVPVLGSFKWRAGGPGPWGIPNGFAAL